MKGVRHKGTGEEDGLWLSQRIQLTEKRVPGGGVLIQFIKGPAQRYSTVVHRRDRVQVEVVAGGYNQVGGPAKRIPHDLAHFIVEDELGLDWGLWGLLTAGVLLHPKNTRVIAGRQPPHAARRSREILDRAGGRPMQVELAVRAVADLALAERCRDVKAFRAAMGSEWDQLVVGADDLERMCRRVQESGALWEALGPWETLDVVWSRPPAKG